MIRRARAFALLGCFALVVACSATSRDAADPSSGGGPSSSASAGRSASPGAGGGSGSGTGGGGATSKPGGGGGASQTYPDNGSVGAMATSYLRASPASELRVEIDWVQGREPGKAAIDHLRSVLLSVVDSRKTVIIEKDQQLPVTRTSWSAADVDALERTARQRRSGGGVVTMWIVYLNGEYAQSAGALGVAYKGSASAIFRDRIDDATTAVLLASEIERSVLTHEAGHLLGLVNLGYRSPRNHEDPEHPHHSSNPRSVMYWQVEDVSIRSLLNGGPPDDFDDDDRADLAMLRSGG